MKASILAVAAALAAGASASAHGHGHAHMHEARADKHPAPAASNATECVPECYTVWQYEWEGKTYTVPSPTPSVVVETKSIPVVPAAPPKTTTTQKTTVTSTSVVPPPATVLSTYTQPGVCPTPIVTTCPTPGTYSIPATTVTITKETTVCAATTTTLPAGPATYGGVVTVVVESTTVVCPYATVVTNTGVVTSTVLTTTYVCPSAGTYTPVPPTTTTCVSETVIVYPVPKTYAPGTYTAPATVVTATVTDYVYYCPYESATWVPAPTTAPASKPASAVAVSTSSASTASKNSGSSLGGNGKQWAITYTPYNNDAAGGCKARDAVFADIAAIAKMGFLSVRIYSTDCSGLANVGDACAASGLKLIVGVFIDKYGISKAQSQVTDLVAFAHWEIVELVVIGNEAVFNGFCSAGELMAFVASCRQAFGGAGYTGLVTITEPLNIWQANAGTFCGGVDIVGCTLHPFFNSDIDAAGAGAFALAQLTIADGLCPGKEARNLEIGWPSSGSCNGAACPGKANQKSAITSILDSCGSKSVVFSFGDDGWKAPGEFGCEQFWGLGSLFA